MARRPWQVFFDTSALIAGILSPSGDAHEILRLCEARVVQPFFPRQVLVEADRNLTQKLPQLLGDYQALLRHLSPRIVEDPSQEAVERVARIIHRKDASILAAALEAEVDFLLTWDKKHFHQKAVKGSVPF
ncbi:MAG: PIN domain-containing protein [Nitrospirae bacterium]|nr:PIN domain-containing protein [Nitrospirota bacterium]